MKVSRYHSMLTSILLAAMAAFGQVGLGTHARGSKDPLFTAQELLGRPTDTSITINAASIKTIEVYFEYGIAPGAYSGKTAPAVFPAGEPVNVLIDNLKPNTRYYYRMRHREPGTTDYSARDEHTFHTQRPPGSVFTFAVQFDPHLDENTDDEAYKISLKNMLADKPDFLVDVGDNFFVDRLRPVTRAGVEERVQLVRSYYDILTHSSALFLGLGNHEGEARRNLNGTPENIAVYDTLARKRYIPNPIPNGFYTGSAREEPLVGVRQANFAWQWGDALFIMLDPFWNKPAAPELGGDWSSTLGREQYDWLKTALETSKARFKFVFSHNLIGGRQMSGSFRGGIEAAKYLEMGGYNLDDTWGFDKARPGWPKPIHQLMADSRVTIFFHGHDHLYAKQDLDGVVYQAGPQPGARNTNLGNRAQMYDYSHGTILGGAGYLRVRVSPDGVTVDYVQTWVPSKETPTRKNGTVADTYTIHR
jgi:hypothetical protein